MWQQSKSISMHALIKSWWQLAVTLSSQSDVTQPAQRAFLSDLYLSGEEEAHPNLKHLLPGLMGNLLIWRASAQPLPGATFVTERLDRR